MIRCLTLLVLPLLIHLQETSTAGRDWYSAVVVEYSPDRDPTVDSATNILNNVRNFVNITNIANDKFLADIIVFPEIGLVGYGNQVEYMEVPDPQDLVRPCATNTTYEAPLVQLSCAARATQTYIVVNVAEKFYNSSQQKNVYFNTDVVFDSNGTIIARYRKIHLFLEGGKTPSPNRELVYFDTSFGVRFGIFTCFDIIFEDPGIILVNEFNITHFIFPTAWFSQLPFLTAIQEQYYWSYTQDVVLLASGYNAPAVGSSGSGIYLGRRGPATYNLTQTRQTFMLHATVPKKLDSTGLASEKIEESSANTIVIPSRKGETEKKLLDTHNIEESPNKIKLKQDFVNMYTTKTVIPPAWSMERFNGFNFLVPFTVEETICQNTLCCKFSINITAVFSKMKEDMTRGDDYSQLYYRLAVFDGVQDYAGTVNGGLQVCGIVSCVNPDVSSCGLRSDDFSAQPNMIYSFFQTAFIFDSITINGNFSSNRSLIGPNALLTGEGDDFGSLLSPDSFIFGTEPSTMNDTDMALFKTINSIPKLVTASLYGRLYLRDNENSTQTSESVCIIFNSYIILIGLLILKITHI